MTEISLESFASGAIQEHFARDFQKILENIYDPNTSVKIKRKLTITLTLVPGDEDRNFADIEVQSKINLAPIRPVNTRVYIDAKQDGKVSCVEWNPNKMKGQIDVEELLEGTKEAQSNKKIVNFQS